MALNGVAEEGQIKPILRSELLPLEPSDATAVRSQFERDRVAAGDGLFVDRQVLGI